MFCYEFCDRLQAINRNVTGCQYRGRRDPESPDAAEYNEHIIEANAKYGDCLFFKGEEIVPGGAELLDPNDDHKYTCRKFDKLKPTDYSIRKGYKKIYPVDRKFGSWESKHWVTLRLPENDLIRTHLKQIRIDEDLSNRPDLKIEVIGRMRDGQLPVSFLQK